MKRLRFSKNVKGFEVYHQAIRAKNAELSMYLERNWIPIKKSRTEYCRRGVHRLNNGSTNRVEAANRYIKGGLSRNSTIYDCVKAIFNRNRRLELKFLMGVSMLVVSGRWSTAENAPASSGFLTAYAQDLVQNNCRKDVVVIKGESDGITFNDMHIVHWNPVHTCRCSFQRNYRLPCRHNLQAVNVRNVDLGVELKGTRWERTHYRTEVVVANPSGVISVL